MQGSTLRTIASYLNENGFVTSRGGSFSATQVSNIKKMYS